MLRAVTVGLAGTFGATTAAAIVGAGWLVSVSLYPPADDETAALAPPLQRLAWFPPPAAEAPALAPIDARFPSPEMELVAVTSTQNPATVFALATATSGTLNDARAEAIFTGSLGTPAPKPPPPPKLASVAMFAEPPAAADAKPAPAPRARTQLAALTPPTDLGVAPPQDSEPNRTAIYDISAQVVHLPNGERLEAHSGLGKLMDDPRHVHRKMHGATPPNTYRLSLREALFHGVQALRMTPEDDDTMHGRAGILAHTYMLGPNGQSNGCVSFKDYPKFLRAYLRGEVDRIVVVARMTKPPAFYARNGGKSGNTL